MRQTPMFVPQLCGIYLSPCGSLVCSRVRWRSVKGVPAKEQPETLDNVAAAHRGLKIISHTGSVRPSPTSVSVNAPSGAEGALKPP